MIAVDEPRDTGGVDIQDYQVQLDAGNGNSRLSSHFGLTVNFRVTDKTVDN